MWQLVVLLYWQTLPVVPCCVLLGPIKLFQCRLVHFTLKGFTGSAPAWFGGVEPEGAAGSTSSSQQPHRFAESFSSLSSSSGIF
ncbi:hypothetical protein ATANTOWER_014786 [Ataeniobius toweri]|uniref:Secreted protein n=1 Tax=Ataeniobius toweri TaxID=208326 RepID=A0ABU7BLQ4_9TELE|nr:hypothetical protein [Ataeniobius toweri]